MTMKSGSPTHGRRRGRAPLLRKSETPLLRRIASYQVPDGDKAGLPFQVLPWEKKFIQGLLKPEITIACLSMGRGGGKSGLLSAIAAAWIDPEHEPRKREVSIFASSHKQARIIGSGTRAMLEIPMGKSKAWKTQDTQQAFRLESTLTGSVVEVRASDVRRSHGLRSSLVICDEPSQWVNPEGLWSSILTSQGKREGGKVIVLGTASSDPCHFFSRLMRDDDPSIYHQVYCADVEADPFRPATWRQANPGLRYGLPLVATLKAEARRARKDPHLLQTFRALRLNQGVDEVAVARVLSRENWDLCEVPDDQLPDRAGLLVVGLDLGDTASMSAAAGYWPETGRLDVLAQFPSLPDLEARTRRDGFDYSLPFAMGELSLVPGRTSKPGLLLADVLEQFGKPAVLVGDRFKEGALLEARTAAGLDDVVFLPRGNGYKDGSEDLGLFRRACLDGAVKAKRSMLLRAGIAGSVVVQDESGNEKVARNKDGAGRRLLRNDTLQAAVVAVAEGVRRLKVPEPPTWSMVIDGIAY